MKVGHDPVEFSERLIMTRILKRNLFTSSTTVTACYITLVTVNNDLFLAFVKDNFLCQINEKHVGTSNVSSLAVPESTCF